MDLASLIIEGLTLLAIVFAVLQLVGDRNQRHREFENLYVQRYWNLEDSLSDEVYLNKSDVQPTLGSDYRLIVSYLRLCEDQIDIRREGFVTDRTWKIWADGIRSQLEEPVYKVTFKEMETDLPSLAAFLETRKDTLDWNCLKKWWKGIK